MLGRHCALPLREHTHTHTHRDLARVPLNLDISILLRPRRRTYACIPTLHANEQVGRLPGQPKKEEKVDQAPLDVNR